MNNPHLFADKLIDLVQLAAQAETAFEKAAVFSAAELLTLKFLTNVDRFHADVLEVVTDLRWNISAALGYDIDNGFGKQKHIEWAVEEASNLKLLLSSE